MSMDDSSSSPLLIPLPMFEDVVTPSKRFPVVGSRAVPLQPRRTDDHADASGDTTNGNATPSTEPPTIDILDFEVSSPEPLAPSQSVDSHDGRADGRAISKISNPPSDSLVDRVEVVTTTLDSDVIEKDKSVKIGMDGGGVKVTRVGGGGGGGVHVPGDDDDGNVAADDDSAEFGSASSTHASEDECAVFDVTLDAASHFTIDASTIFRPQSSIANTGGEDGGHGAAGDIGGRDGAVSAGMDDADDDDSTTTEEAEEDDSQLDDDGGSFIDDGVVGSGGGGGGGGVDDAAGLPPPEMLFATSRNNNLNGLTGVINRIESMYAMATEDEYFEGYDAEDSWIDDEDWQQQTAPAIAPKLKYEGFFVHKGPLEYIATASPGGGGGAGDGGTADSGGGGAKKNTTLTPAEVKQMERRFDAALHPLVKTAVHQLMEAASRLSIPEKGWWKIPPELDDHLYNVGHAAMATHKHGFFVKALLDKLQHVLGFEPATIKGKMRHLVKTKYTNGMRKYSALFEDALASLKREIRRREALPGKFCWRWAKNSKENVCTCFRSKEKLLVLENGRKLREKDVEDPSELEDVNDVMTRFAQEMADLWPPKHMSPQRLQDIYAKYQAKRRKEKGKEVDEEPPQKPKEPVAGKANKPNGDDTKSKALPPKGKGGKQKPSESVKPSSKDEKPPTKRSQSPTKKRKTSSSSTKDDASGKKAKEGPKRPLNAYLHYCASKRDECMKENPGLPIQEVSKMLGMSWRAVSAEEKAKFQKIAKEDKERFIAEGGVFVRKSRKPNGGGGSKDTTADDGAGAGDAKASKGKKGSKKKSSLKKSSSNVKKAKTSKGKKLSSSSSSSATKGSKSARKKKKTSSPHPSKPGENSKTAKGTKRKLSKSDEGRPLKKKSSSPSSSSSAKKGWRRKSGLCKKSSGASSPASPSPSSGVLRLMGGKSAARVKRNEDGSIVFPIKVGRYLLVDSLGTIDATNDAFHSERYIWPTGFQSRREYHSTKEADKRCMYTCTIQEKDGKPWFTVVPQDDPSQRAEAKSASSAWSAITQRYNALSGSKSTVSGPVYFGFGHPTIARLVQDMPNAEKLKRYERREYTTSTASGSPTKKRKASDGGAATAVTTTAPSDKAKGGD